MSERRILTVGLELASADVQHAPFDSNLSLLDWDIILFKPQISGFLLYSEWYQGKPSLSDTSSFRLKECCEHWRREIKQAFETGKTVLVYLSSLQEVYVDTGQRSYSGTGRNQRITQHVALYSNYQAIPATIGPVAAAGTSMKLSARASDVLAPYWSDFEDQSKYEVLLTEPKVPACVVTRTGDKPVGAMYRSKASFVLSCCCQTSTFTPATSSRRKRTNMRGPRLPRGLAPEWSQQWWRWTRRCASAPTSLLYPSGQRALGSRCRGEGELRVKLLEAERNVEQAQKDKEQVADALRAAGTFRSLLFEKGKPLETVIIEALRLLGFQAARFRDSDSEFDVVLECLEGRLIGEAEGKDNKAVNIDKLRQLTMNVHEDLQRDEVTTPAKAVLFGNGFRLQPLDERPDPFSAKCYSAAATSSTALVFTPDLFAPVQYLMAQTDAEYSRKCREVILATVGRVKFPEPPSAGRPIEEVQVQEAT